VTARKARLPFGIDHRDPRLVADEPDIVVHFVVVAGTPTRNVLPVTLTTTTGAWHCASPHCRWR